MRRQVQRVTREGVHDELYAFRRDAFDALLNDVIGVLIPDASKDVSVELGDERRLPLRVDHLQRLLHDAAPVHLQRHRHDVTLERRRERRARLVAPALEHFLNDVIAEDVRHERARGGSTSANTAAVSSSVAVSSFFWMNRLPC